jgi:hypothetical protein
LRVTITIACLLAAGAAALLSAGAVLPSRSAQLSPCPELGPNAGAAARKYELRCLINKIRERQGRRQLVASTSLRLAAERLLSVRCERSNAGCGATFDSVLRRALRAQGYAGTVRYVYFDVSQNPAHLAAYIRRRQSWLPSRTYRDLGIAFRPAGKRSKPVWIVIAGYRY